MKILHIPSLLTAKQSGRQQRERINCLERAEVWSDKVVIVKAVLVAFILNVVVDVDLVAEEASNATEAFAELVSVGGFVRDEFNLNAELFVVEQQPIRQTFRVHNFEFHVGFRVAEELRVLLLLLSLSQHVHGGSVSMGVSKFVASVSQVLPEQHNFEGAQVEGLEGVLNAEDVQASVEGNLLEKLANNFLLLHETHIPHRLGTHRDSLIETIIHSVADVEVSEHDRLQTSIENVRLEAVCFDLGWACHNNALNVRFVVSNKVLCGELADSSNVIMTLFLSDTCETQRWLTTATVLLWQLYLHALQNFLCVTLESGVEDTITIDDNESELLIVLENGCKGCRLEGVLTAVGESVDWLEWLNVNRDLLFRLSIAELNHSTEEHQAIWGHRLVQLQF